MNFNIENIAELSNLNITPEDTHTLEKDMKEIMEFIEKYGKGNY